MTGVSDYFGILRIAKMPAVIVEPFFIDNAIDRQIGDTTDKLRKIGVHVADAIASVYGSNLKGGNNNMFVRLKLDTHVDLPEVPVKVNGSIIGKRCYS